jgi:hypothetical protein
MKANDIIVCIDNKLWSGGTYTIYPLTINKKYKVLDVELEVYTDMPWVLVNCNDGSKQHFAIKRFITLREYNLKKLNI